MASYLPNSKVSYPNPVLYTPDFSYIDKMLRRRQAMYEQGYAQVAGKYNALNKDMTNPVNREFRDQFLKQANENLKNLSAMDLSIPQNVQAAASVFQPFYTNKAALGDIQLTQHWNQQESIAESYRLKDGGKEYSDDNINFVRMQRQQYAVDNPESWMNYYGNRRSYNPYYDYNKEVKEAMKEFKPSNYPIVKFQGLYMIKEEDKSWREAEIRKYLDGVLSDKAKQQMRIESSVRLASSPETLTAVYGDIADKEIDLYNQNIKQIDKEIALEKDAAKLAELKKIKTQFEDSINDVNSSREKLMSGDPAYLKANADRLAYQIYYNQSINKLAKGFSYNDVKIDVTPDQAAIALMREDREDRRAAEKRKYDYNLKMLELQGFAGDYTPAEVRVTEDDATQANVAERYAEKVADYNNQGAQLQQDMKKHVLLKINEGKPEAEKMKMEDLTPDIIDRWLKTGGPGGTAIPKTDFYYQKEKDLMTVNAVKGTFENTLNTITEAGYKDMSEQEINQFKKLSKTFDKPIKLDDGTTLDGKTLYDGIVNGTIKVDRRNSSTRGGENVTEVITVNMYGKEYKAAMLNTVGAFNSSTSFDNKALYEAVTKIQAVDNTDLGKKFNRNREAYIKTNFDKFRMSNKGLSFPADGLNAKKLENAVSSFLPPEYNVKHMMIGTTAMNAGNGFFYITPKEGTSFDADQIVGIMKGAGADASYTKTEGGGVVFEVKNMNLPINQQFRDFSELEKSVISELMTVTGSGSYSSTAFTTPYGDTRFQIKKENNLYYLYSGNNPNSYNSFSDPMDAIYAARLLSANGGKNAKEFDAWWGQQ